MDFISITATSSVSCQKAEKQNYARLHYLLKDDLMKMEAITQETRLLCRNHIDTAEQLCSYKGSLETEMSALLQKRKEFFTPNPAGISGEEKGSGQGRDFRYFGAAESYPKGGQTVRGHFRP